MIHVFSVLSATARIASCIDRALPYATVTGVGTVAELEGNLTEVDVPINVTLPLTSSQRPVTLDDIGCFIGGAGEYSPGSDSILLCTLEFKFGVINKNKECN